MANTYYILTNKTEISLCNKINELQKMYNQYVSINGLYFYKSIIEILVSDSTKDEMVNSLINIDYSNQDNENWDNNYNYQSIYQLVESINAELDNNYDKYNKNLLNNIITKIDNEKVNVENNNINLNSSIENLKGEIDTIISENNGQFSSIVNEKIGEYNSLTKKFIDSEYLPLFKNQILRIVSGQAQNIKPIENIEEYLIVVGNKLSIKQLINIINNLYSTLIDNSIYYSEYVYGNIIKDFIDSYTEGNKAELLEGIKSTNENYINSEENVKQLVDNLINGIKDNYDPEYVYTGYDKNSINNIISEITNRFNQINEKNNETNEKINNRKNELNERLEEYKNTHDGEEYQYQLNETINEGEYDEYKTQIDEIYSKELPNVSNIILDPTQINLNVGDEYIINLSYLPEQHKDFNIEDLIVNATESIISNIEIISKNQIRFIAQSSGECSINVELNGVHASVQITIANSEEPEPTTKYYFYIGDGNNVITEDYSVNASSLESYSDIDNIIGTYNFTSAQYIVLPENWYNQIKFTNSMNMVLTAYVHKGINIENNNYVIIEGIEPWTESLIFTKVNEGDGGVIEIDKPTDPEEPEINYYWYVGQTDPSTMTEISPIVTDISAPGWREIGTTLPTYIMDNPLWDGSLNKITTGDTKATTYVALPNSTLKVRDGDGNDVTTSVYSQAGIKIINSVTYYIYKIDNVKIFNAIIF